MITQEALKQVLNYEKETGIFTWRINSRKGIIGKVAGSINKGYLHIRIFGKNYKASRLAWLYIYGEWPEYLIDHKDHNTLNDKIDNLRDVTFSMNNENCSPHKDKKTSKYLGVHLDKKSNKFIAQIQINKKKVRIGEYESEIEAKNAYLDKKRKFHAGCLL